MVAATMLKPGGSGGMSCDRRQGASAIGTRVPGTRIVIHFSAFVTSNPLGLLILPLKPAPGIHSDYDDANHADQHNRCGECDPDQGPA
jgi:hypothetical protein